jgi:hypothetical protein
MVIALESLHALLERTPEFNVNPDKDEQKDQECHERSHGDLVPLSAHPDT